MDDLLEEFIAETRETLEALSGEIVAWEAAPEDRTRLDAIFRFVHTVKGSCGFLDLPRLARLSHAAEDVLAAVRDGTRAPDRALVNAVLAVVDRIGEIVEAIDAGSALDDTEEELLIAALAEGSDEVAQPSVAAAQRAPARSVRLNVELLDRMMSGMSDMVLARNELSRRLRDHDVDPQIEAALERMSATVAELRDTVTRTRMQKIEALFSALPRMVRDTAAGLGKSVMLQIEGAEVELDREMIEVLRDPLVHIVRNSIDHGIEPPAERRAAGKRENGRLTIAARQSGNQIIVEIADDGRGIDIDRLIRKLADSGRDERELRALSARTKLNLIFEPGLSSKDEVTEVSGRGVGMDVVRAAIEQIGGRIDLENAPGRGLRILIHVPLTLSIIPTIVIGSGAQRYAIPRQAIEEIVSERSDAVRVDRVGGSEVVTVRDRRLPLVDLARILEGESDLCPLNPMLVIVSVGAGSYALRVADVLDNEELVIKPASPAIMATGVYAGMTLPDNGCPMLLLDCAGIAQVEGLVFSHTTMIEEDAEPETASVAGIESLVFMDMDGVRRAVPLSVVDRIEQVGTDAMRVSAGRLRLTIDGRIIPLVAMGDVHGAATWSILRLQDGAAELAYVIAEAADIVTIAADIVPADRPGPIAGVALLDDEPVEVIDPHWLFAAHLDAQQDHDTAPLCLISGGDHGWMRIFLKPMLEKSGYRVTDAPGPDDRVDVILTLDNADSPVTVDAPVVRLRSRRDNGADGSIYRYDRETLLRAMETMAGRRAG
ncbi:MAG: chemotaxis protein CheA [Alphaproteobacteria bacterium HGW-Alphaproteobacteria-15]|nr:MAG: chemotaxis protein CheA [Alphaproteobacteria bacterium HGW-Alphaproteobacteria-15]